MDSLRAFIAVEPSAGSPAAAWLEASLEALRSAHPRIRWVRPEHLHLTLKFLGSIPAERVEEVGRVLDDVAAGSEPFELELGRPGRFGPQRAPRALWIGFLPGRGLELLLGLQAGLERALEDLGFPGEDRGFTPHLTLGRNPHAAGADGWDGLLPVWPGEGKPRFHVEELRLYSSDLRPGGPVHTVLREERLGARRLPAGGGGR